MKGYNHHFGLERYEGIEAINMGSQVLNEDLVAKAIEVNADANTCFSSCNTKECTHSQFNSTC